MAEELTWIGAGHRSQEKAWQEALAYGGDNNKIMENMRKAGVAVSVGVRRKNGKYYVVIIKKV